MKRENYSSGAPLEDKVGYSRMVRIGDFVFIGGTTSVQPDGSVYGENDPYEQAKYILSKQINLLIAAGSKKEEVFRIKAYTTDMKYAAEIGRAYSEFFRNIRPVFTMVGTNMLNRPSQLVEVEMEAAAGSAPANGK